MELRSVVPVLLVAAPLLAGYVARKRAWASEGLAEAVMTAVLVAGYPVVGFFSIWGMTLRAEDIWLPALGAVHMVLMSAAGIGIGRLVTSDRTEVGLVSVAVALGNTGVTMGGMVLYYLYGKDGLALVNIYSLMWTPMIVLLTYPIARHYAPNEQRRPLWRLILRSLLDWRSIGLPVSLVAIALSLEGVQPPRAIASTHLLDVLIVLVTVAAFFSIGLRLHLRKTGAIKKIIAAVSVGRFGLGLATGWGLVALTLLTPWPLNGVGRSVFLVECFVPTAVTMVGVANMFNLKPQEASALFLVNTLLYVAGILPIVLWVYGG